jgi:hypothetical protein
MKFKLVLGYGKVVLSAKTSLSVRTSRPGALGHWRLTFLVSYVTLASKVFHNDFTYDGTIAALKDSIANLGYCKSCTFLIIFTAYKTGISIL